MAAPVKDKRLTSMYVLTRLQRLQAAKTHALELVSFACRVLDLSRFACKALELVRSACRELESPHNTPIFYLPFFLLLFGVFFTFICHFFSFICRPFSTSLSDHLSPRAKLRESARHTTRVRTPNDSSPSAVGTRVRK